MKTWAPSPEPGLLPIGVGIVADRETTAAALEAVLRSDPELAVLGTSDQAGAAALLERPELRVVIVNLRLSGERSDPAPGVDFIREIKRRRPDIRVLSLKRQVDEDQLRAALDAGADACCLAVTAASRVRKAIKVVAEGATWLDPEVAQALFHHDVHDGAQDVPAVPHLSPRQMQILRLLVEGYTNDEIAAHIHCAYPTVRTHLTHLYRKLGVEDRVSAAVYALRRGLVSG
jgi:NarL family two-component system response regulator LiaR